MAPSTSLPAPIPAADTIAAAESDQPFPGPSEQPIAEIDAQGKPWMPKQVLFTPAALDEPWGQQILQRVEALGLPVQRLKGNRITGLRGKTERETYIKAKQTLAVVVAPPSQLKLSPIPPSADWQFHLATGCPAHCQYCYLAGSLQGPPVVRVFANLPQILDNLQHYEPQAQGQDKETASFEVSCYTDPLGIEHLTEGLAECIRYFGQRDRARLRWVSKFDAVEPLLDLPHNGHTRCRISLNAPAVIRQFEGGTAPLERRLQALRRLALPKAKGGGGYPIGVVLAPIMAIESWREHYTELFERLSTALDFDCDLTFELISHRFTPGSKTVLTGWYPKTALDLEEGNRVEKRNKFGGKKYVYGKDQMKEMRGFFEGEVARRFAQAEVLYWT